MTVKHLSLYDKLTDLQRMLTLIPPREHEWWQGTLMMPFETEVPDARYAVTAKSLTHAWRAAGGSPGDRLALAFTDTGVGVWDRDTTTWTQAPVLTYDDAETTLCAEITRRGANG